MNKTYLVEVFLLSIFCWQIIVIVHYSCKHNLRESLPLLASSLSLHSFCLPHSLKNKNLQNRPAIYILVK